MLDYKEIDSILDRLITDSYKEHYDSQDINFFNEEIKTLTELKKSFNEKDPRHKKIFLKEVNDKIQECNKYIRKLTTNNRT